MATYTKGVPVNSGFYPRNEEILIASAEHIYFSDNQNEQTVKQKLNLLQSNIDSINIDDKIKVISDEDIIALVNEVFSK